MSGPERIEVVIDSARQLKRHVGVDVTSPRGAAPPGAILAVRPNPPPPPPVASHAPSLTQLTLPAPQSHTQVRFGTIEVYPTDLTL